MIDKLTYLETETEKYPMAFTLNVMEALQDEYGSLDDWSKSFKNTKNPNIKALKFFMMEAINEGIDIEGKDREPVTLKQVGRILTTLGLQGITEQIQKLVTKSTPKPGNSKNGKTTQSQ